MNRPMVSIGQVKRDISKLVNRVTFGGERIILTSRGKPKAALVSIKDLQILEQTGQEQDKARRMAALERAQALSERIHAERPAHDVDSVELLHQLREERTDELLGLR